MSSESLPVLTGAELPAKKHQKKKRRKKKKRK